MMMNVKRGSMRRAVMLGVVMCLALAGGVQAERVFHFPTTGSGATFAVLPLLPEFRFGNSNDFAVELWVKPNNVGNEVGAVFTSGNFSDLSGATGTDGVNGAWGLYWQAPGFRVARRPSVTMSAASTGAPYGGSAGTLGGASTNTWHHLIVNWKRTGSLTFYVDGALVESQSIASWALYGRNLDSVQAYRLGNDPSGTNQFKGAVDEVRFWNRVRTETEIATAFQQRVALNGNEPGLLAYYRCNETGVGAGATSIGQLAATSSAATSPGSTRVDDPTLILTSALPPATDYAFSFNGVNQSIDTQIPGSKLAGRELSIAYWFKGTKLLSAVRLQAGNFWVVSGWNQPLTQHIINTSGSNNLGVAVSGFNPNGNGNSLAQNDAWHHVAMTWKSGTSNGFISYFDGVVIEQRNTPDVAIPSILANVWLGSFDGTSEFLQGSLDEVSVWNRALTRAEISGLATNKTRLFGFEAGLAAYYQFNDGDPAGTRDRLSSTLGLFRNMGAAQRVVQDGVTFIDPILIRTPNPASAGLWIGEVSLRNVNEVAAGATNTLPAGGQFDFNILLHVEASGAVRLLKDVTIMQKRNTASSLTEQVLLTDDTLIPNYDGVLKRAGKLVGVRYSSPFFQFAGQTSPMAGGLGFAHVATGTNMIPASLPTNPFRHKFHPTHKDPRDLQGAPYDVERKFEIFFREAKVLPGEGRDRLRGTYRETIKGLHKQLLITDGEISLERISLVNKLNNQ